MVKNKNFIGTYFSGKTGDKLRGTITPDWSEANTQKHLDLVRVPENTNSVCEIGCGIGRLLKEISDNGVSHCVGFDASSSMIKEGKEYVGDRNIQLIKVDGNGSLEVGIRDYFDFAFSIITFQHIPSTETVLDYLGEAHRVLIDGGEFMFQVLSKDFNKGELWTYHCLHKLEKHLVELGFKDIELECHNRWTMFRCKK